MNYRPKARTSDFVEQTSGDDTLIYDLKSNKAVCLNETAAIVWKLCDGKRTVSEIAGEIGKQLKSSVDNDLVWLALDQLNNDGLLMEGYGQNERFKGLTRREVIKKIGIGSMVALPIVSSIVAPQAINAQSGVCAGTCIAMDDNICAGCPGGVQGFHYPSTDGSCSGPVGTFLAGGCTGFSTRPVDFCRTVCTP